MPISLLNNMFIREGSLKANKYCVRGSCCNHIDDGDGGGAAAADVDGGGSSDGVVNEGVLAMR